MGRKRPAEPAQPSQPSPGGPSKGPLAHWGAGKPHCRTRAEELRAQHRAVVRGLFHWGMGRDNLSYRVLRGLGASPMEILHTLLDGAMPDPASKVFILAMNLPGNLAPGSLWELLHRYQIHPLSLALHLGSKRRAMRVLRRLGLLETYGPWLAPWGLHIHGEPDLVCLPPGLVLDGDAVIEDCPRLVDLGQGLTVTNGTLVIRRCAALERLPDGLTSVPSGNIDLIDCPRLEHLGAGTRLGGMLTVVECPWFKGLGMVRRHSLED